MSDGKLTITIDGDEAKAHAAYISLTKDQKDLVAEIGKMGIAAEVAADKSIKAAQAESNERKIQIRMADALVKQNETLTQTYERQKASLDAALSAGKISSEQYKQTLDSLQKKVHEGSVEFQQASREKQEQVKLENAILADQLKVAENIVRKTQSVTDKFNEQKAALEAAHTAGKLTFDEYQKGLAHITDEAAKANGEIEYVADATEEGVGQKSLGKVVEFAAKFATIAAAVDIVRKALEFYNAEKETAMGSTNALDNVRTSLRQVSKGDLAQLEAKSEDLTKYGLERVRTKQLTFDARSMGFEGHEGEVAFYDPVIPVEVGANIAGNFRKIFEDEGMSIERSYDSLIAAAGGSPQNVQRILPTIQKASEGRLRGEGESSDILAASAALFPVLGESTGDRIKGLRAALNNNEATKGKSLIEAVEIATSDPELRKKITGGSVEVINAMNAFESNLKTIKEMDKSVEQAQSYAPGQGMISRLRDEAMDPNTQIGRIEIARREARAAKSKDEFETEMAFAEKAFGVEKAKTDVHSTAVQTGDNLFSRFMSSAAMSVASMIGADGKTVETVGDLTAQQSGGASYGVKQAMRLAEQMNIPAEEAVSAAPTSKKGTGKTRVIADIDGRGVLVEEGSKEEAEIMARQRELGRQRSDAELQKSDPALLNESRSQTSAIQQQTSTLVAAMQGQARALSDISEKLNFQAV